MIAQVAEEIKRDSRQSIDDVATLLGMSHVSVQSILHNDLKMQRVCGHVVPRSLKAGSHLCGAVRCVALRTFIYIVF